MNTADYIRQISVQVSTASGILAGFSFAVLFQIYTADEKKKIDSILGLLFLVSSLALIYATILGSLIGSATFSIDGELPHAKYNELMDQISSWLCFGYVIGYSSLFAGIGLGGFRFSRRLGFISIFLALCVYFCLFISMGKIGVATGRFDRFINQTKPNNAVEPTTMRVTDPANAGSAPRMVAAHFER